jgi:hypothetical protein
MELLIPGLALVALMIYASTKIKKAAAQALETEDVETDEFSITKPAGFINIVSPGEGLLFHAYTKEFSDDAPNFRKAEATIRVIENSDADRVLEELKRSGGDVAYQRLDSGPLYESRPCRIDRDIDGVKVIRYVKLLQKDGRVYQFQFDTPAEFKDEFGPAVREMNDSFALKDQISSRL